MGGQDESAFQPSIVRDDSRIAVCLVSGGMDSCVSAAIAKQQSQTVAFLHISYGQRTEHRERQAFERIADYYNVEKRLVVSIESLSVIGGSSLTDDSIAVSHADLHSRAIPSSYVPFRNGHFLAIATSWAEVIGASQIYVGAVAEDSSGYPDCRPEFYEAFQRAADLGTKPETSVTFRTPVIDMSKTEIIQLGLRLGAPLQLTWSCYQSSELACGECDSCALRLRAFRLAGADDPISYVLDSKRFAY